MGGFTRYAPIRCAVCGIEIPHGGPRMRIHEAPSSNVWGITVANLHTACGEQLLDRFDELVRQRQEPAA